MEEKVKELEDDIQYLHYVIEKQQDNLVAVTQHMQRLQNVLNEIVDAMERLAKKVEVIAKSVNE